MGWLDVKMLYYATLQLNTCWRPRGYYTGNQILHHVSRVINLYSST